jgi:hypothetical protein
MASGISALLRPVFESVEAVSIRLPEDTGVSTLTSRSLGMIGVFPWRAQCMPAESAGGWLGGLSPLSSSLFHAVDRGDTHDPHLDEILRESDCLPSGGR